MPHICDNCGEVYENGSQAMLSGCDTCEGTTFQYVTSLTEAQAAQDNANDTDDSDDIIDGDDDYIHPMNEGEDDAQRAARNDIVTPDELSPASDSDASASDVTSGLQPAATSDTEPDTDADDTATADPVASPEDVRNELMDQFESIKILSPGEYELNLRELYEREEHIIQVREDGRYVIQMPEDEK